MARPEIFSRLIALRQYAEPPTDLGDQTADMLETRRGPLRVHYYATGIGAEVVFRGWFTPSDPAGATVKIWKRGDWEKHLAHA